MSSDRRGWVCCHLGAREHYAVPRALHKRGRLLQLVTDAWVPPGGGLGPADGALGRLAQRHHAGLSDASIHALTGSLIGHELLWRAQGLANWDLLIARNAWFQERAAAALQSLPADQPAAVFAHSYAAGTILRDARRRGWMTVLGQIDPGPRHYRLQEQIGNARPEYGPATAPPPRQYFDDWRRECDAADHILVNSAWARDSIVEAGIDTAKITIVPLPYERDTPAHSRMYPDAFSATRPLRILFVGAASVMKGAADLLEAFESLDDPRMELYLVGERSMSVPERFAGDRRIHWIGPVDRMKVMEYYRISDVLVFPSHSDGFGMAQVEARAWALPIVASPHCGRVVDPERTGVLLDVVSAAALAAVLRRMVDEPSTLARFSVNMQQESAFGIDQLADSLLALLPR